MRRMEGLTTTDAQAAEFRKLLPKCTVNDVRYIVRSMKHDLRTFAGPKHILDALHPKAYDAWRASHSLKVLIDRLGDLKRSGDGDGDGAALAKGGLVRDLSVRASLMTAVKPMLAEACRTYERAFSKVGSFGCSWLVVCSCLFVCFVLFCLFVLFVCFVCLFLFVCLFRFVCFVCFVLFRLFRLFRLFVVDCHAERVFTSPPPLSFLLGFSAPTASTQRSNTMASACRSTKRATALSFSAAASSQSQNTRSWCVFVCACVRTLTHTLTHPHTHSHTLTHLHTHSHTLTHTCVCNHLLLLVVAGSTVFPRVCQGCVSTRRHNDSGCRGADGGHRHGQAAALWHPGHPQEESL